ncbi:hypothetical protein K440DRAFT_616800 [Wilcoxina mikolae CBS 423.85]|nr:hypothetical protein K440DRAFT_616800 [Wilcoxina mikolae CBS 423.85]
MASPTSSSLNRRRSLRTLRANSERLAECGHDLMHIDPSSERDLKCDICWRNRETLIMRLLEPFERALRGVGPSGEIDQEEIDRLEREDREREREREEKRKAAEEARRRKEEESKRKRERMRAMQEERRGKGGKFEKKKPKVDPPPPEKKTPVDEKKDTNAWNAQQVKGSDGKFLKAKGKEEGKTAAATLEKALGADVIMKDAPVEMTRKAEVEGVEEKPPLEVVAVNPVSGEPAERKTDGKSAIVEMTSMTTDLPPKPEQLQTTANTATTSTTELPTLQNDDTKPVFPSTSLDSAPQRLTDDTPSSNFPSPPRLRSRTSSIANPSLPPHPKQEEPESTIRVVQAPVETRASRRRSKSTSTPRSRSVSKSSPVIQKAKKAKSQPRRASASTASTAQLPSPVQMRLIPVDSSMLTTAATTSAPAPLSQTPASMPGPEKQQHQRSIYSFFHPTSVPTSGSSGSESPTTISSSTTATPITTAAASAAVERQSKGDKEDKRVLRERERKKIVKEEDSTGRRKSTRAIAVNYCESSDEDEPGV